MLSLLRQTQKLFLTKHYFYIVVDMSEFSDVKGKNCYEKIL